MLHIGTCSGSNGIIIMQLIQNISTTSVFGVFTLHLIEICLLAATETGQLLLRAH